MSPKDPRAARTTEPALRERQRPKGAFGSYPYLPSPPPHPQTQKPPRTIPSEEANLSHSGYLTIIPNHQNQSQQKSTSQAITISKTEPCGTDTPVRRR